MTFPNEILLEPAVEPAPEVGSGVGGIASDKAGPPRRGLPWPLRRAPAPRRGRVLVALAAIWLIATVVLALGADLLPLRDPTRPGLDPRLPPSWTGEFLGTDTVGRSQLSRVIYGARASLLVGVAATLVGVAVGVAIGLLAGYFRRRTERVLDVVMDTLLAFPPLILLLALTSVLKPSISNLILALAIISIPGFGRVGKANTLVYANREFVDAAKVLGGGHFRILLRELAPNVFMPVISVAFIAIASLIVAEGSLSFLGLGIPAPTPSWGGMMAAGKNNLATDPALVFVPAAFLFLTVFALNVIGDRVQSGFDVRQSAL